MALRTVTALCWLMYWKREGLFCPACVPQLSSTSVAYAYLQVRKAKAKLC